MRVARVVKSGRRLRGDVLLCPVIAHKLGGAGTRALLKSGVRADLCINMEHSNNTIANLCVGMECPEDHPLVQALALGQRLASGSEAAIGG